MGAPAVLGTNIYRPPEARVTGRVGVAADAYGVAMTLFEMVNGRIAWEELDLAAVEARLRRGLRAIPDSRLSFAPHVPDRLRRCLRKALHRDPAQRYPSVEAFITALRKVHGIDWSYGEGDGVTGEWTGTYPPHRSPSSETPGRASRAPPRRRTGRLRIPNLLRCQEQPACATVEWRPRSNIWAARPHLLPKPRRIAPKAPESRAPARCAKVLQTVGILTFRGRSASCPERAS
jgi:serine/threonine protein kinase